jgi:Zn-dependent peptidase ImmA (M78 family)
VVGRVLEGKGQDLVKARQEATRVLQEYLVDNEGMLEIPINPILLAERMGISVNYSSTLGDGVSGVIVKEEADDMPRIYLNVNEAPARQKFTCAHEIGHYLQRKAANDLRFGFVDSRDELSSTGTDANERAANGFAAELLMPAFAVRKFYADGLNASKLAREFGVSEQAMNFRLRNLYLV